MRSGSSRTRRSVTSWAIPRSRSCSATVLGALGEQVQLHVRMRGRRAREHRPDQPRLELL